jgi:uncharacterized protein (TIGR03382 family)
LVSNLQNRAFMRVLGILVLVACGCAPDDIASQNEPLRVCADGPTVDGIDVSYWQGTIDWDRVAAAGVRYAYIRASVGLENDTIFPRNWPESKRVGILRGAYHYFKPELDVDRQAQLMIDAMRALEPDDLPPVLDIEHTGGVGAAEIVSRARRWVDLVEAATGRQVMVYTGKYWWQDNTGASPEFVDHPLWVPQYGPSCPDLPDPWTEWLFFQTSNTGRVDGISGDVDLDLFNGDMDALRAFANPTPVCGDGFCHPSETHESCAMDCPICEPIPAQGRVVEEDEICFEAGGDSEFWREEAAGSGDHLIWTYTVDGDTTYNFAVWHLDLAEAGDYLVEVHTPASFAMARDAEYTVRAGAAEETYPLDQTAVDGWSPLGELAFAAGPDQWIRVNDNTGEARDTNTRLVADAIRLTRIDTPVMPGVDGGPPVMPGADGGVGVVPPPKDPGGGCSASSPTELGWMLLPLLALARRRRR